MKKALAASLMLASCAVGARQSAPPRTAVGVQPNVVAVRAPEAAASQAVVAPSVERSLYARLGGKDAISAVVDNFLGRVAKDERINGRFWNADLPRLRTMLIEFICEASGGPCKYTGKGMKAAHAGMRIAGPEFDALVENLKGALDQLNVPAREQGELLGALGPLKPEIVADPKAVAAGGGGAPAVVDSVVERARALRQASSLLEKANSARLTGDRSFADQLFSSAELIAGAAALADLAPLFRQGAPPRVVTPLKSVPSDAPAQPATVGNSDEDQPESKRKSKRGSLTGSVISEKGRPLPGFAVVTLEPVSGNYARRAPRHRVIEQRNREFAPRVLAVPVGSTVTFPNFDAIYHNVFSRSGTHPFDLGIYKAGLARQIVFNKAGVVRVGCNLHANMSAFVLVVAAPHYAVADSAGRFAFRSVEPGRYRLRAWTENSESPSLQTVDIKEKENAVVVTLGPHRGVVLPVDKFGVPRGGAIVEK